MVRTILVLAANPKDTPSLRLDQEVREISNGLQRARKRDQLILKQAWAPRPRDVRRAMLDFRPHIVHFCGHGTGTEGIAFEDETGQAHVVDGAALAALFSLFAETLECIVLNACYSEVQAEELVKFIPYVIGMRGPISDAAALEFAVALYDALGAGETIEFAYKFACSAIQWWCPNEASTPKLKAKQPIPQGKQIQQPRQAQSIALQTIPKLPFNVS